MRLKSLEYEEWQGDPRYWRLEGLDLGAINLLVGLNASGKSRTLNVINGLSNLLCGRRKEPMTTGSWRVVFSTDEGPIDYELEFEDGGVAREVLRVQGRELLTRGPDGLGEIFTKEIQGPLKFKMPSGELAAVSRRDEIQHAFLAPLATWAESVLHYPFGSPMGRDTMAVVVKETPELDPKDPKKVVGVFKRAEKEHGRVFVDSVLEDMRRLGYALDAVGVGTPTGVTVSGPGSQELLGFFVHERGVEGNVEQVSISQGMFRALSLIVQVNYALLALHPSCILIDDIGEGLDFGRSSALIELIVDKASQGDIQVIMSTNDKFVMNHVPLEYWSLLDRDGPVCRVRNYANSREIFEEFEFTGLSNFDFLTTDFFHHSASETEDRPR